MKVKVMPKFNKPNLREHYNDPYFHPLYKIHVYIILATDMIKTQCIANHKTIKYLV